MSSYHKGIVEDQCEDNRLLLARPDAFEYKKEVAGVGADFFAFKTVLRFMEMNLKSHPDSRMINLDKGGDF
ncbi:MAG: hypothetical protein WCE68_06740 [Anaerolineales bacterium]